jgi:hypothetical protein
MVTGVSKSSGPAERNCRLRHVTPIRRKLIKELVRRGKARQTSEDRKMLDYAIAKGEGDVYLRLPLSSTRG